MHAQKPAVVKLQIHLPHEQTITFNPDQVPNVAHVLANVQQGHRDTTLTAFFKANRCYPDLAHALLYHEFPQRFVWHAPSKEWKPRQHGFAIGHIYYVQPTAGEKFYLHLLLTAVHGPVSFMDLKTYRNITAPSFEAACCARGLLANDQEWSTCLEDAAAMHTGSQLRRLFATILMDCAPSHPGQLWMNFQEAICDDLKYALQHKYPPIPDPTQEQILDYGLFLIDNIMQQNRKSLTAIPSMPTSNMPWVNHLDNPLIADQLNYDTGQERHMGNQLSSQFN